MAQQLKNKNTAPRLNSGRFYYSRKTSELWQPAAVKPRERDGYSPNRKEKVSLNSSGPCAKVVKLNKTPFVGKQMTTM